MKRKLIQTLLAVLTLAVILAVGGYLFLGGGRSYSSDLGALRAQFNQDRGKARLLMVLSPT